MISRRTFFLGLAVIAVPALLPHRWNAVDFMTKQWNVARRGAGRNPKRLFMQSDLFNKFESDLKPVQRYVSVDSLPTGPWKLAFKSITAHNTGTPGWGYHWEW